MQKRDYVLCIVVAIILVSLSLSIILPDVNELITALIVTIAAGVVLFIFKQYFFRNDIPYSKKEEHTKNICEIYRLLTRVGIAQGGRDTSLWNDFQKSPTEYKHYRKFPTEYKSSINQFRDELYKSVRVEQIYEYQLKDHSVYLHYDRALEHLKKHRKYKHIYKHWENTKNLLDELNGKTSIEERLEGVINEKMHDYFPALRSSRFVIESSDHYNPDNIVQFMMKYFRDQDNCSKYAFGYLAYEESAGVKLVYSKWNFNDFHIIMRSDGEIDFETYKKFMKEMQEDCFLKDFYNESVKECSNITKELNDFKDKLEKLVQELRTGKLIEGKCDVGF